MKTFEKIETAPLWNRVRGQIKDALLAGRFEPGQTLTLRSLAEMFGTSVTPVRDAINHLVAQGVLEAGPRNAAVVPDVASDLLKEIIFVRAELEGRAAREAATRKSPELIAALSAKLESMRSLIRQRQLDTYLDVHRDFHFTIYESAGIPLLYEMIENLWLRTGPILTYVIPDYVVSLRGSDHHQKIVAAIEAGDGPTAEAEIVSDIEEAANYLLSCADEYGRIRRGQKLAHHPG
ncbi:MAG: GntR family transcriptional regulator [Nitratireductor sp.]|nr:GntR family transcriptional regulator [Nitratireductor sp.]